MNKVIVLLCAIVLATLAVCKADPKCPAGEYFYQPLPQYEGNCIACDRGDFCPGDDKSYECRGNSVAPYPGMSECDACTPDFPLASPVRTFCMPPDVPKDAVYLPLSPYTYEENVKFSPASRHLILEMIMADNDQIVTLVFYNQSRSSSPFGMYLSTKTGNPSQDNYEFKAFGQNITIPFQKTQETIIPFYITLDLPGDVYVLMSIEGSFEKPVVLTKPVSTLEFTYSDPFSTFPYIFYQLPNIKQTSKVNITLTIDVDLRGMVIASLYASPNTALQYPTKFNHVDSASKMGDYAFSTTTHLVLDNVNPGDLYFSAGVGVIHETSLKVTISVEITPR